MPFYNRVWFTVTTSGTDDFTINAALTGFRTPEQASVPDGTSDIGYVATSIDNSEWEIGRGAFVASPSPGILERTTVLESSNSNLKVNFTSAPRVLFDLLAQDLDVLSGL